MCAKTVPAHDTPGIHRPEDFDDFWTETLAELNRIRADYRVGTVVAAPEGASLAPVKSYVPPRDLLTQARQPPTGGAVGAGH